MDYFAVISLGAYPAPTPTSTQRAAFASSYGLLSIVPEAVVDDTDTAGIVRRFMRIILDWI